MYDWYMKHLGDEYGIEIPENIAETKIAKIKVIKEGSRELKIEKDFPLKELPKIKNSSFDLSNEDYKTLANITKEIFDKLNFD